MNAQEQTKIAKQHSVEFPDKPVWLYQYGPNTFGFRFSELERAEKGVLIGCYYKGKDITPKQAERILIR